MTIIVPVRQYNLGNGLSVAGCAVLLAQRIGAQVFVPQFQRFDPLFSGAVSRYGDPSEDDVDFVKRQMIETAVSKGEFRQTLADRRPVKEDEYFAYYEISAGCVLVARRDRYFTPLEEIDEALVASYSVAFLYQPYQYSYQMVRDVTAELRDHFALAPAAVAGAVEVNQRARGDRDHLIGVHLRLGDYRTWRDGRYAFEFDEILELIRAIERRAPGVYACRVFTADLDFDTVARQARRAEETRLFFDPADVFEDFAGHSQCDILLGPPSSFGHWAAFIGGRRRLVLDDIRIQRLCVSRRYLEALPAVVWPFSIGLQNDFWVA